VGRSEELVRLDCGARDRRVRDGRLHRRLPEDHAPVAPWTAAALQDGRTVRRQPARRAGCPLSGLEGAVQHAADLSVLQEPHSRSRVGVRDIRGRGAAVRDQRGEFHRWPRWPRDQHGRRPLPVWPT
jgi:hypothetical protein